MMLVVVSKIKAVAKAGGLRTSQEFCDALSKMVGNMVIESAKKCKEEDMGTIKARHLNGLEFVFEEE